MSESFIAGDVNVIEIYKKLRGLEGTISHIVSASNGGDYIKLLEDSVQLQIFNIIHELLKITSIPIGLSPKSKIEFTMKCELVSILIDRSTIQIKGKPHNQLNITLKPINIYKDLKGFDIDIVTKSKCYSAGFEEFFIPCVLTEAVTDQLLLDKDSIEISAIYDVKNNIFIQRTLHPKYLKKRGDTLYE